jgi:hypothetical protein
LAQKYEIKIMIFVFMEAFIFGIEMHQNTGFKRKVAEKCLAHLKRMVIKSSLQCNHMGPGHD